MSRVSAVYPIPFLSNAADQKMVITNAGDQNANLDRVTWMLRVEVHACLFEKSPDVIC